MNRFSVLTLFAIIFTGCFRIDEDKIHSLASNDKALVNKGDTLVYKSNYSNYAKYCVMQKKSGFIWVSISKKDGETSHPWEMWELESLLIDSVGKVMTEKQKNIIYASHFSVPISASSTYFSYPEFIATNNYTIGSTFTGTGRLSANWYGKKTLNYYKSASQKILHRDFKNVIYYDLDTSSYNTTAKYVIKFYCNSQQGLLGFVCSKGEIFELVE
jgi:hypothetical protein